MAGSHFMTEAGPAAEKKLAHVRDAAASNGVTSPAAMALGGLAAGIPLVIGVCLTVQKASVLFK